MCSSVVRKTNDETTVLRWPSGSDTGIRYRERLRRRLAEMVNIHALPVAFAAGLGIAATVTVATMMASLDLVAQDTSIICKSNQTGVPDERQKRLHVDAASSGSQARND